MPALSEIITDYTPSNGDVGVPLASTITVTFDRLMDTDRLKEDIFTEGPDTDQWIGPGLLELKDPENVSQGDLDNFLKSPGYRGIVQGSFLFQVVDSNGIEVPESNAEARTKAIFTPTQSLHPLITYTVHIQETLDNTQTLWPGYASFSFDTGSGSIQQLPSSISSSILSSGLAPSTVVSGEITGMKVLSTVPLDFSIDNSPDLSEIVINFDKDLDAATVTQDQVVVEASVASDHPNLVATAKGKLAKQLVVSGKTLTIKI